MAQKTQKSAGRFAATDAANAKAKVRAVVARARKQVKSSAQTEYGQRVEAAKKSPPPQSWFEEDISKLHGPKR